MLPSDYPMGPGDAATEAVGFHKMDGMIQLVMAVWVPGKGWLHTRRGIVRHGIIHPPTEDEIVLEARGAYRAITHRLKEATDAVGE